MKLNKTILFLALLCAFMKASAQLSTHEQPVSFNPELKLTVLSKSSNPTLIMPSLDMSKIEAEDEEDEKYDMPPRFGYSHFVNYDLNNSGTWYKLPNGDKLWQLEVVCPSALSVNFCYDKFWIPEGGKLFVYSKDRKHIIGAFTSKNNKGDRENIRGFAMGLVYGDDVVLEYYQPKDVTSDAIICIKSVVHGYRYIRDLEPGYGVSGSCVVNVNCNEGQNWQYEKRAVALIIVGGNRWCTGSLINTTDLSHKPYFLTANHCIIENKDAAGDSDLSTYTFYWDYEESGCVYSGIEPSLNKSTSGATIVANPKGDLVNKSDFALLRLSEEPNNITGYTPYYWGWDKSGQSGDSGVCIHHPSGDVKKIATVLSEPLTDVYRDDHFFYRDSSYWKVFWKETENGFGVVKHGSSGSPLLNSAHKVIGQLRWGSSEDCDTNPYALYGRFDVSWTGVYNSYADSIHRRLDCWLDSLNTGIETIEGLMVIPSSITLSANQQISSNIAITGSGKLFVTGNVEIKENCRMIVEPGGQLKIEGGRLSNVDLVLKPGAILEIIEGGILDTRNGFEAPSGASVFIDNGKIL